VQEGKELLAYVTADVRCLPYACLPSHHSVTAVTVGIGLESGFYAHPMIAQHTTVTTMTLARGCAQTHCDVHCLLFLRVHGHV
jgi:hypothetical protein